MDYSIEVDRVSRVYKLRGPKPKGAPDHVEALTNVTMNVERGEVFGFLGPNGAGKTTLIKILSTLLLPSSGSARVDGYDVASEPQAIRRRISMVSGGETSGYGLLTVEENLWMFARFYGMPSRLAKQRIAAMLDVVGLREHRRKKISDLSTGLRQKMNFIRGFISDPSVVFLDEPTLGLDVGAAREVRAFVKGWMADRPDRTLLLTTHYMAEADELCDRIAIIDKGAIIACDTPENLKHSLQREAVFKLKIEPLGSRPSREQMIEAVPGVRQVTVVQVNGHSEVSLILEGEDALGGVLAHLNQRGSGLIALEKKEPTLEDVFVDLVGRSLAEDTSHTAGEE